MLSEFLDKLHVQSLLTLKQTKKSQRTYFSVMFHFYTPLQASENAWFSGVSRG